MFLTLLTWVGAILAFLLSTWCFYFFPRTIAGIAIVTLFLGKTDLGSMLGIFSVETGDGDMGAMILLLSGIFLFWCLWGLRVDIAKFRRRWEDFSMSWKGRT